MGSWNFKNCPWSQFRRFLLFVFFSIFLNYFTLKLTFSIWWKLDSSFWFKNRKKQYYLPTPNLNSNTYFCKFLKSTLFYYLWKVHIMKIVSPNVRDNQAQSVYKEITRAFKNIRFVWQKNPINLPIFLTKISLNDLFLPLNGLK